MGAPRFAARFPREPALDALVAAFARGDFGRVRAEAPKVIRDAPSAAVRASAEELLRRTMPHPLARLFFLLTASLLVLLSTYWWWRASGRV